MTVETEEMRFNTGIAAMMEFMNAVYKWPNRRVQQRQVAGCAAVQALRATSTLRVNMATWQISEVDDSVWGPTIPCLLHTCIACISKSGVNSMGQLVPRNKGAGRRQRACGSVPWRAGRARARGASRPRAGPHALAAGQLNTVALLAAGLGNPQTTLASDQPTPPPYTTGLEPPLRPSASCCPPTRPT